MLYNILFFCIVLLFIIEIFIFITSLFILLVVLYYIIKKSSNKQQSTLTPTLDAIENIDLEQSETIHFPKSDNPEIETLHQKLSGFFIIIKNHLNNNKQFTQNASHELQTPLAIIQGHAELLLNAPNLGQKEIESISIILQNASRLSRINQALILLSKIDNRRFTDIENVNLCKKTLDILQRFKDSVKAKNLTVEDHFEEPFFIEISDTLADILITNLIQNAIRHNIENGKIVLKSASDFIQISNSGLPLSEPPQSLFKRFARQSDLDESLGLGLSIVERICQLFDLEVTYHYTPGNHTLTISKVKTTPKQEE